MPQVWDELQRKIADVQVQQGIKVGIEAGRDKLEVVREVVAENMWPLLGATAIAKKFMLGPGSGGRIQVRSSGPDSEVPRQLGEQAMNTLREDGGWRCASCSG